jgi:hypothetical protein
MELLYYCYLKCRFVLVVSYLYSKYYIGTIPYFFPISISIQRFTVFLMDSFCLSFPHGTGTYLSLFTYVFYLDLSSF